MKFLTIFKPVDNIAVDVAVADADDVAVDGDVVVAVPDDIAVADDAVVVEVDVEAVVADALVVVSAFRRKQSNSHNSSIYHLTS